MFMGLVGYALVLSSSVEHYLDVALNVFLGMINIQISRLWVVFNIWVKEITCLCTCIYVYVCMCICIYVYMYVYICVCRSNSVLVIVSLEHSDTCNTSFTDEM
jgi:hypothetical protein